jgi:predicted RNA-binding protein with PIN domain
MSASHAEPREDATGVPGGAAGVDWVALPDPLRAKLADAAATAVGGMDAADVPPALRRIAGFTPAKRAKLGGPVLLAELAGSAAFRAAVVAWWAEHRPAELVADPLDDPAVDPLTTAAAAVLTGDANAADAVAAAARRVEVGEVKAERDTLLSKVDKLTAELERLRGELTEARAQAREAGQQRETEFLQLRRRLSEQGAGLRAALDARAAAEEQMAALRTDTEARLAAAAAECDRERGRAEAERRRADRAATEVAAARQAAREARQADETRLALLVDTLGGAVAGLRRELAIGGGGPRPADLVTGAQAARSGSRVDTIKGLDSLLAVPTLHLVVDGYNVSKTGYPDLPLADQRSRLITQLGALAARTRVEITVVFDGAGVMAAPPRGARGVRVLFSEPGVLADDVIRSIVAAEPHGRPVAVVTADRAVVDSVRAWGAYAVPSTVLVTRLCRP